MPRVTEIPDTWQGPIVLAKDMTFQCITGQLLVTNEITPAPPAGGEDTGIWLQPGDGFKFLSGDNVYYRRLGSTTATMQYM